MRLIYLVVLLFVMELSIFGTNVTVTSVGGYSNPIESDTQWGTSGGTGTYTLGEDYVIESGATLIVYGDLEDTNNEKLTVESGATLIVYGNVDFENTKTSLSGNVIVIGDVTLKNTDMVGSSNLVIGGVFTSDSGNLNSVVGDVYLLDPSVNPNPPDIGKNNDGTEVEYAEDLIANEDSSLIDLIIDTVGEVLYYTWEGGDSNDKSDWDIVGNWSSGAVPTQLNSVTIPVVSSGNEFPTTVSGGIYNVCNMIIESEASVSIPEGSTVVIANNLIIESNAVLNIGAGVKLTIKGDATIDQTSGEEGKLIVNNTDASPTSVIIEGNVTGNITENWDLEYDRWWYISHPLAGDFMDDYKNSLGTGGYYLYVYDNSAFKWNKITNSNSNNFKAYDAIALGILQDGVVLSYSGALNNNSSYTYTATDAGYQNVGNPYASYIDFKAIYDEGGMSEGVTPTSYIYTTVVNESGNEVRIYATYNAIANESVNGGGSRYISPGQCFWVQTEANETLEISKNVCTNNPDEASVSLKSVSTSGSKSKIKLLLSNANTYDELLIFGDGQNGSETITAYDSKKKMNSGVIGNLYSVKEDTKMVINSLPAFYDGQIIPLGYSVSTSGMSDFTIQVADLSNVDDYNIYLDDLQEGTSVDLKEISSYTFNPSVPSSNDRFQIRLESSFILKTTDISNTDVVDDISIYSSGSYAYVKVAEEWLQSNVRNIKVYDVKGKLINDVVLHKLQTQIKLPDDGIYVIKVMSGSMVYQQKVFSE